LRGKIVRGLSYQIDKTLTVEGVGGDAKATGDAIKATGDAIKATGDAINALRNDTETALSNHVNDLANPHGVTKVQVGLGNVDNTSDENKPVSTAQAKAIADAKKAGTDAQTAADNAMTAVTNALTNALEYVDNKIKSFSCVLTANGWEGDNAPYKQTVNIEGILGTDRPHWGVVYSSEYDTQLLEKEAFALVDELDTEDGKAVFTCFEDKPANDLNIQMEVHR
jgi:hypothetical protein